MPFSSPSTPVRRRRDFLPASLSLSCVLAVSVFLALTPPKAAHPEQSQFPDATFDKTVKPFFATHCIACHSRQFTGAGLNLEAYTTANSLLKEPRVAENILGKIRSGQMPPARSPRPPSDQVKAVSEWLDSELKRAEQQTKPEAGRVTVRRLNRAEYNNTVRDLFGIDLRPADDFPQDDSGYGFDNIGDVLSLSPVLMERYLTAADKVTRAALFGQEPLRSSLVQLRQPRRNFPPLTTIPAQYDLTGLTLRNSLHTNYRFPATADYALRVVMTGQRPPACEPMNLGLWVDGKMVEQIAYDPKNAATMEGEPQELAGLTATFPKTRILAGDHWVAVTQLKMYEGLPPSYGGLNPSKRPEPPPRPFTPPTGAAPEEVAKLKEAFQKRSFERKASLANAGRLFVLEIGGPYEQVKGPAPASKQRLYTCGHLDGKHQPDCARKILTAFARRAFRRPVTAVEVTPYVNLVSLAESKKDSFEEGLCVAMQAILVSPHFLFRVEKDVPETATAPSHPISQYELASRLSYFLWSSMPDDELLKCAEAGTLRKPLVLEAQVRRMLLDPKASALVENFAGQWLELRKLESLKPDLDQFPAFDEYLRISMRRETELFLQSLLREDRSILDCIDGDYTFLNERLAKFYQIPGVTGPAFRKVALAGTKRSGLLTQASVLTVSSYSTRTSPVLRGKWILDNFLNAPPPPPPPDVPTLDVAKVGTSVSLRQQLEEHRKNPTCASCHQRMDPLGFGLENFDAVGAWRTKEGTLPIEASGTLPSGQSFQGPAQLKAILKEDKDAFTECLTEKLLTYALGRGLEGYDRPTVKRIAQKVAQNDYRFSSLILEIVNSLPFQQRKGTPAS